VYISFGYKDEVDVQELRSNVLAVDTTLSQAPSAKDFPVPGRSAVACSEPNVEAKANKRSRKDVDMLEVDHENALRLRIVQEVVKADI